MTFDALQVPASKTVTFSGPVLHQVIVGPGFVRQSIGVNASLVSVVGIVEQSADGLSGWTTVATFDTVAVANDLQVKSYISTQPYLRYTGTFTGAGTVLIAAYDETDRVTNPGTSMDSPFKCGNSPVSLPAIGQNKKLVLRVAPGSVQVNIKKDGVPSVDAADYFMAGGDSLDIIGPCIVTLINVTGDPFIYWTFESLGLN